MFGLEECAPLTPTRWLSEGDEMQVGEMTLKVLHCPGHTPGHIVFINEQARLALVGDVLFNGGVGRSDFPRGDHQALIASIRTKLLPLGDDMRFIPGHGDVDLRSRAPDQPVPARRAGGVVTIISRQEKSRGA